MCTLASARSKPTSDAAQSLETVPPTSIGALVIKTNLKVGLAVAAAIAVLLLVFAVRGCSVGGDQHQEQHHSVIEEGDQLVFVLEQVTKTIDQDLLLRQMPVFCGSRHVVFVSLDEEEPEGVKVIQAAGIKPPLMALYRKKQLVKASAWPGTVNDVEAFCK